MADEAVEQTPETTGTESQTQEQIPPAEEVPAAEAAVETVPPVEEKPKPEWDKERQKTDQRLANIEKTLQSLAEAKAAQAQAPTQTQANKIAEDVAALEKEIDEAGREADPEKLARTMKRLLAQVQQERTERQKLEAQTQQFTARDRYFNDQAKKFGVTKSEVEAAANDFIQEAEQMGLSGDSVGIYAHHQLQKKLSDNHASPPAQKPTPRTAAPTRASAPAGRQVIPVSGARPKPVQKSDVQKRLASVLLAEPNG